MEDAKRMIILSNFNKIIEEIKDEDTGKEVLDIIESKIEGR